MARSIDQQIAEAQARLNRLKTRAKATETRRKIIVGAIVTTEALKDPKIARWMAATLRKNATREVDQKELIGLLADLDAKMAAIGRSQAVIEFNMDGEILHANANFLAAMGYDQAEVVGRHHRMFVALDEGRSTAYEEFWGTLKAGQFVARKFLRLGKCGREVWIQASYNPLIGADGYFALVNQSEQLGQRHGLHPHRVRHLLDRYGSLLHGLLAMADDDPSLLEPVPASPDYLRVEIAYAVAYEGALHLDDVLTRRTRISIEYAHRGVDSAEAVGAQMAPLLGWTDEQRDLEVSSYIERVQAERQSQSVDTDIEADKLRVAAPDPRAPRLAALGTG